jgi:subtilase family serine protease
MHFTKRGVERVLARTTLTAAVAAAALAMAAPSAEATPFPTKDTPAARDLGASTESSITVTVLMKHRDAAAMEQLAADLYNPAHPSFHQFLSAAEFHRRFDPSADAVKSATAYFQKLGLTVHQDGVRLEVTGSPKAHAAAFGVVLHQFEVPAHGKNAAYRFHAAVGDAKIGSPAIAALVDGVVGFDNAPRFAPNVAKAAPSLKRPASNVKALSSAGNDPGFWTVNDLAAYYNVNPLYAAGQHGEGRTIGIVTLASFTPSDAFQYWSENGLTVDPNRITVVPVNGGSGPISDAGGSGETTLDVEQSGGLAPAANIVVYEAPNTNRAFLNAFAMAVNQNVADSISVSWGSFEWFDTLNRVHGGKMEGLTFLKAFNDVFMQAAMQGQSLIAAQGDAGAYEANRALPVWQGFAPVVSVGGPASSPWITSAGGTTLPGVMVFTGPDGGPFPIKIKKEQAWGWSYMTDLCAAYGADPVSCGIFPSGGGGGVSSFFKLPAYQKGLPGIRVTEAGQSVIDGSGNDYVDLPAGYRGRNVPDVSMNADPNTGYVLDYTSETGAYGQTAYYGGTSFVAPQLNGIAALLVQHAGGRVGLLNFPLYALAHSDGKYQGASALRDITTGDNWFYQGGKGYDNASGLGTLNVANFADFVAGGSTPTVRK